MNPRPSSALTTMIFDEVNGHDRILVCRYRRSCAWAAIPKNLFEAADLAVAHLVDDHGVTLFDTKD